MAKTPKNIEKDEDIGTAPQAPLVIHKQYLKDLSFENPNAPGILQRSQEAPEMEMNILLDVQKLDHAEHEHFYEVTLTLNATAKREGQTMFLAEVIYCAAASVQGLEPQQHHPLLFIEVPNLIFPFARQIMANATQAGGFMPLQLTPVDFRNMYLQRFAQEKTKLDESNSTETKKPAKKSKKAAK